MLEHWSHTTWPEGGRRPIPESYWVRPGRLLAGEYAGARSPALALRKLRRLLDAGISSFVDLTEAQEAGLPPYEPLLAQAASLRGVTLRYRRLPIGDMSVPTPKLLQTYLDNLDAELVAGQRVYLHCWGGIGRTGTVIGCHLVRHGLTGVEALALIARLRRLTPDRQRRSPATEAQRAMVLRWTEPPQGDDG